MPGTAWIRDAACAGMDARAFFASNRYARAQVAEAKRVCSGCPVRAQCAEHAITTGERWGVWGGMSQQQLRQRRRRFADRSKSSLRDAA